MNLWCYEDAEKVCQDNIDRGCPYNETSIELHDDYGWVVYSSLWWLKGMKNEQ